MVHYVFQVVTLGPPCTYIRATSCRVFNVATSGVAETAVFQERALKRAREQTQKKS